MKSLQVVKIDSQATCYTLQWLEYVPGSGVLNPMALNLKKQENLQRGSQELYAEGKVQARNYPWQEARCNAADKRGSENEKVL